MATPSTWSFLSAHHLLYQVLSLVERAESHAVMVTAYLDPWPNLELVLRQAVARGVEVHVVTRSIDDTHNDKARRAKAIDRIRGLGVHVHEVDSLHAKLYLNEREAIVASLNLTAGGQDSPNLGVHLQGAPAAREALQQLHQWLPGLSDSVTSWQARAGRSQGPAASPSATEVPSSFGNRGCAVRPGQTTDCADHANIGPTQRR